MERFHSNLKKPCGICLYRGVFGLTFISSRLAVNKKTARCWVMKESNRARRGSTTWRNQVSIGQKQKEEQSRKSIMLMIRVSRGMFLSPTIRMRLWYKANAKHVMKMQLERLRKDPTKRIIVRCRHRVWYTIKNQGGKKRRSLTRELLSLSSCI